MTARRTLFVGLAYFVLRKTKYTAGLADARVRVFLAASVHTSQEKQCDAQALNSKWVCVSRLRERLIFSLAGRRRGVSTHVTFDFTFDATCTPVGVSEAALFAVNNVPLLRSPKVVDKSVAKAP